MNYHRVIQDIIVVEQKGTLKKIRDSKNTLIELNKEYLDAISKQDEFLIKDQAKFDNLKY
jgi:hypothetical protein